jgi:hypothetical protein
MIKPSFFKGCGNADEGNTWVNIAYNQNCRCRDKEESNTSSVYCLILGMQVIQGQGDDTIAGATSTWLGWKVPLSTRAESLEIDGEVRHGI